MRVTNIETDLQRAEAIQIIQTAHGKNYEKLEKCLQALLACAEERDEKPYEKQSQINFKNGNVKGRLSTEK